MKIVSAFFYPFVLIVLLVFPSGVFGQSYAVHYEIAANECLSMIDIGRAVVNAGDVDGDGYEDFAASTWYDPDLRSEYAAVMMFSGKTGKQLWKDRGPRDELFGDRLTNIGDVNSDGIDDLAISSMGKSSSVNPVWPKVKVVSGISGFEIYTLDTYESVQSGFIWNGASPFVSNVGDVNNDGKADVAISHNGVKYPNTNTSTRGVVLLFTKDSGQKISSIVSTGGEIGESVKGLGDINADGHDDFVVGISGGVRAYSGKDLSIIYNLSPAVGFGRSRTVVEMGDLDTDGTPDFAMASNLYGEQDLYYISGIDGTLITHISVNGNEAIDAISGIGDYNGDGYTDVVAAIKTISSASPFHHFYKELRVYSGSNGSQLLAVNPIIAADYPAAGYRFNLATLADRNGDQKNEILLGAPFGDPPYDKKTSVLLLQSGSSSQTSVEADICVGSSFWDIDGVQVPL